VGVPVRFAARLRSFR